MRRLLLIGILASALAVPACGSSESGSRDTGTASTSTSSSSSSTTTTEAAQPKCSTAMADAIVFAYTEDVFDSSWSLHVVSPEGDDLGAIDTPVEATMPSWSPDHSQVAFEVPSETGSDIAVIGCDGSGFRMLTDDGISSGPAWSPDGDLIAFVSQGEPGRLWAIYPNGSGVRIAIETSVPVKPSRPAWYPDNVGLVFVGGQGGDKEDLYEITLTGTDEANITTTAASVEAEPSVAPDGHAMAFFSDAGGDGDQVWVMTTDNTSGQIGHALLGTWQPAWSPSNDQVVYVYNEEGRSSLWLWDSRTGETSPLLVAEGHQGFEGPDWAAG